MNMIMNNQVKQYIEDLIVLKFCKYLKVKSTTRNQIYQLGYHYITYGCISINAQQ